jgi:hypothetical protein
MQMAFDEAELLYDTADPSYKYFDIASPEKYWAPSWYSMGVADWYIIGVGTSIYKIVCEELHTFVDANGWDKYHHHLSPNVKLQHTGRRYTDYRLGLLKLSTLLDNGVMTLITQ